MTRHLSGSGLPRTGGVTVGYHTVGITLWVSHCGYHTVGITLWVSHCGYHTVGIILWVSHCGYHTVGITLWVSHCGYHTVGIILWVSHCGYHTVGITLWVSHCWRHAVRPCRHPNVSDISIHKTPAVVLHLFAHYAAGVKLLSCVLQKLISCAITCESRRQSDAAV